MSFTMLLLLAYIVMGVGSFIAFKRKHKAIGIALLLVIVLSILILGYQCGFIRQCNNRDLTKECDCMKKRCHSESY